MPNCTHTKIKSEEGHLYCPFCDPYPVDFPLIPEVLTEPFPKPPHPTVAEIMALIRNYRRAVITTMQWDGDGQAGDLQEAINRRVEIFTNIGLAVISIVRDRDRLEQILRLSQSQCDAAERRYAELVGRMAGEWNKL